jgi:hypothetical protein
MGDKIQCYMVFIAVNTETNEMWESNQHQGATSDNPIPLPGGKYKLYLELRSETPPYKNSHWLVPQESNSPLFWKFSDGHVDITHDGSESGFLFSECEMEPSNRYVLVVEPKGRDEKPLCKMQYYLTARPTGALGNQVPKPCQPPSRAVTIDRDSDLAICISYIQHQ